MTGRLGSAPPSAQSVESLLNADGFEPAVLGQIQLAGLPPGTARLIMVAPCGVRRGESGQRIGLAVGVAEVAVEGESLGVVVECV